MKQSRFTEEQIIGILKSVDAGQKVLDACRNMASVKPPTTDGRPNMVAWT